MVLERLGAVLRRSRSDFGTVLERLGTILKRLGAILGRIEVILGPFLLQLVGFQKSLLFHLFFIDSWGVLGGSRVFLGALELFLRGSWVVLEELLSGS